MTQLLRQFLDHLDRYEDICYCYDEITVMRPWHKGAMEFFLGQGILRQTEPSALVWLWECEEPDWVEPLWLPDARHGGRIMGFYDCRFNSCGIHTVEQERTWQWAPSFEGVKAMIRKLLNLTDQWPDDVPGRICFLGRVAHQGQSRDVFLVRGLHWPDGPAVLDKATRLKGTNNAAILHLEHMLPPEQRPASWQSVLSLEQTISIKDRKIILPIERIFERQIHTAIAPPPATNEPVLAEQDMDVLEALAAQPKVALRFADLMAHAGYRKAATRASVARLKLAGLIGHPSGTQRKGVAITEAGLAVLKQHEHVSHRPHTLAAK